MVGKDISDELFNDALESVRNYMPAFDASVVSDDEVRAITDYVAGL